MRGFNLKREIPRPNLQVRLILFFVTILVPVIALACILIRDSVENTRQQLLNSVAATAELVAGNVDTFLAGNESLLQAVAEMPQLKAAERDTPIPLYGNLYLKHRYFANIFATDLNGNSVSCLFLEGDRRFNIADREFFQCVVKSGKPSFSGRTTSAATGSPVVAAAIPIKNWSERPAGALVAYLSLGDLRRDVVSLAARKSLSAIVVDSQGTVLVHPDWTKVSNPTRMLNTPPIIASLSGELGSMEYTDADGNAWLAGFAPVARTDWGVVVQYPASLAYAHLCEVLLTRAALLTVTVITALALAYLFAGRIVTPVRRLVRLAESAATAFSSRDGLASNDEMDQLALAFHSLSERLSQNLEELSRVKTDMSEQESRRRAAHRADARESERKRIAGEIHDGITQLVTGALHEARAMRYFIADDPQGAVERLENVQELLNQAIAEMRRIIHRLRPLQLEQMGLVPAIETYVHNYGATSTLTCDLIVNGNPFRLGRRKEITIFRLVQEALANASRHAEAQYVLITLSFVPSAVTVTIKDNGKGFDVRTALARQNQAMGLVTMRERAQSIGAQLSIQSNPGMGTSITLAVPVSTRTGGRVIPIRDRNTADRQQSALGG